jgi:glucan phosphoethanolaminetransferase (alkaline phosphatase superfamily)
MSVDPGRGCIMLLISVCAGMPLMAWLILGGLGYLGNLYETQTFETVKYILIGITCVFYFIVQPFFLWPRLLNPKEPEDTIGKSKIEDTHDPYR